MSAAGNQGAVDGDSLMRAQLTPAMRGPRPPVFLPSAHRAEMSGAARYGQTRAAHCG